MNSHTSHINLYDLTSQGTLFPGLTLALLLAFGKKINQTGKFLSLALAVIVLKTGGLTSFLLPALGPLLYFYVQQLTIPEKRFRWKDTLHFWPLLVAFWIPDWLVLISVIIYLYLSHRLIEDFYRQLRPVLMDKPRFAFRRLDRALLLLSLLCLLSMINATFYFAVAFELIGMVVEAILKPASDVKLAMPITDRSDAREKSRRLREAVAANRFYEDAELTLTTLAVKLVIHPHDLSRIINTGLEKNFSDFINEFRVREIARKMQDPAYNKLTLLGIAYESGFNSQRTFNRIFKEMTGKTPVEYKNSLKKELPIDKLATLARISPVILRSESPRIWASEKLNRNIMFKSYLKTATRFLLKNKTFSLINITGLATGTLCCLYILLYVQDQYSYDKHHKDGQNIYRITGSIEIMGDKHKNASTSPPVAPAIKRDFPEVVQSTRLILSDIFGNNRNMLKYKDKSFGENGLAYVDSTFFDVLSYHFVYGKNTHDVLVAPFSVVLQKSLAVKLFGNKDPIGKVITIDNNYGKNDFKVTGVVDESLGKTHIHANLFVTMNSGNFGQYIMNNSQWAGSNLACSYIKLRPGTDPVAFEKKLPDFLEKHGGQQLKSLGMIKVLHLQAIASIHTTPGYEFEISQTISPTLLYILAGIAIMIQLIACINFMNLSTARASKRAKEVGVRKVIGAERSDLVKQFLGESFLLTLIGVLLALPLLYLAMPYLNQITQANIQLKLLSNFSIWLVLIGIILVTGIVAGSYPAFYLSAFQAIKVIKGNFTNQVSAAGIRRSLVVFQFSLSIVLITSIIIIYSQLNFIKNKDLGFDKNQKLIFSFYTDYGRQKAAALATDLQQLSEVKYASQSNNYLTHQEGSDIAVHLAGGNTSTSVDAENFASDEKFVKANGIRIIAGRDFDVKDTLKVLINETLCKRLGLTTETAPGTRLFIDKIFDGQPHHFDIVGVMKDFNYYSLHGEVGPFMTTYGGNKGNYFPFMTLSVSSMNYKSLLSKIEKVWQKDLPGVPFEYAFLDQEVQKQYEAEITLSNIINSFTIMAILISCLGLFGLAAFSAEQRQKEIGIRKVLGSSVAGIVGLLSKEFIWLVGIAFMLATPLAWWIMHKWLQAFAYKVPISWWMFAVAGALSIAIALLTVSFRAIKAALANPVKSLRSE